MSDANQACITLGEETMEAESCHDVSQDDPVYLPPDSPEYLPPDLFDSDESDIEILEKEETVKTLKESIANLKNRVSYFKKQTRTLKAKNRAFGKDMQEIKSLKHKISEMTTSLDNAETKIKVLTDNESVEKEARMQITRDLVDIRKELEQSKAEMSNHLVSCTQNITLLKQENSSLREDLRQAESKLDDAEEEIAMKDDLCKDLREEVGKTNVKLDELMAKKRKIEENAKKSDEDYDKVLQERDAAQLDLTSLRMDFEMEEKARAFEVSGLETKLANSTRQLARAQSEATKAEAERSLMINALKDQLEAALSESRKNLSEATRLKLKLSNPVLEENAVKNLSRDLAKKQEELDKTRQEIETLKKDLAVANATNLDLQERVASTMAKNDALTIELNNLNNIYNSLAPDQEEAGGGEGWTMEANDDYDEDNVMDDSSGCVDNISEAFRILSQDIQAEILGVMDFIAIDKAPVKLFNACKPSMVDKNREGQETFDEYIHGLVTEGLNRRDLNLLQLADLSHKEGLEDKLKDLFKAGVLCPEVTVLSLITEVHKARRSAGTHSNLRDLFDKIKGMLPEIELGRRIANSNSADMMSAAGKNKPGSFLEGKALRREANTFFERYIVTLLGDGRGGTFFKDDTFFKAHQFLMKAVAETLGFLSRQLTENVKRNDEHTYASRLWHWAEDNWMYTTCGVEAVWMMMFRNSKKAMTDARTLLNVLSIIGIPMMEDEMRLASEILGVSIRRNSRLIPSMRALRPMIEKMAKPREEGGMKNRLALALMVQMSKEDRDYVVELKKAHNRPGEHWQ